MGLKQGALLLIVFLHSVNLISWFGRANQNYSICYSPNLPESLITNFNQVIDVFYKTNLLFDTSCYFGDKVFVTTNPALPYGVWAQTYSPRSVFLGVFTVPQYAPYTIVNISPAFLYYEDAVVQAVIAHELGHVLGLAHANEGSSVMAPIPGTFDLHEAVADISQRIKSPANFISWAWSDQ